MLTVGSRVLPRALARSALPVAPSASTTSCRRFGGGFFPSDKGREHLDPAGCPIPGAEFEWYHDADPSAHNKGPKIVDGPGGKKYSVHRSVTNQKTSETLSAGELYGEHPEYRQDAVFHHMAQKQLMWGNHELNMKIEYIFFYIPTLIIFGTLLPAFAAIYSFDETVFTTMTVRVIGRQWYWIYEVESPTDDGDDDEDDE